MTTSIIIPVLNEPVHELKMVLDNLIDGIPLHEIQIIIVNDGSINPDGTPKDYDESLLPEEVDFMIINRRQRHGVGASFDLGVKHAAGDTIVLMGADIYVEGGKWLKSVKNMVSDDVIACGCSVGLQPGNYDINMEGLYLRYGAKILYTMTNEDLPKSNPNRNNPAYRDILECKWMTKQSDSPYEIPAVLGALYCMKREQYLRMGGFDTEEGRLLGGHVYWGALEPFLSLKARCYGIKSMMYPDFRVGHTFGRIAEGSRANRADYKIWNKLWIAHTLLDGPLKQKCLNHLPHSLNLSLAQSYIRQNWSTVCEVRERNKREGKLITEI